MMSEGTRRNDERGAWRLTDADALRIYGARARYGRFALAWCARERAYHYIPQGVTERMAMGGNVRLRWTDNTAQPARDVHTVAPAIGGYARDMLAVIGERALPARMVAPAARAFEDEYTARRFGSQCTQG